MDAHVTPFAAPPLGRGSDNPEPDPNELSDDELALHCVKRMHAQRDWWINVATRNRWFRWDAVVWREDTTLAHFDFVRATVREYAQVAMLNGELGRYENRKKQANALRSGRTIASVVNLWRTDRECAVAEELLDRDDWLLATPHGVVELRTGSLRDARRDDYMTRCTRVAPGGGCPTWLSFLEDVTGGDDEYIAFLQRVAGYCLTGSTAEHVALFLWGTGANGKSTFLNILTWILADYAAVAPAEIFLETRGEQHPTGVAMLRSRRLVTAQEFDGGRALAEGRIKAFTGGDPIAARYMRGDFFEFVPQFKLLMGANHRPGLRQVDEAIRRRIRLLPFEVTIPPERRDLTLMERLKDEGPGILSWAIDGCLEWQEIGLAAPQRIVDATRDYLEAEDSFQAWLDERTERDPLVNTGSAELYGDYKVWVERGGEHPVSIKRFSRTLEDHGLRRSRTRDGARFVGLKLRGDSSLARPSKREAAV